MKSWKNLLGDLNRPGQTLLRKHEKAWSRDKARFTSDPASPTHQDPPRPPSQGGPYEAQDFYFEVHTTKAGNKAKLQLPQQVLFPCAFLIYLRMWFSLGFCIEDEPALPV